MKVLLDHNIPVSLAKRLAPHQVTAARAMNWDLLMNGTLLRSAEFAGFDVLLTADQGIFYQQNNKLRRISLVVLSTNDRESLEQKLEVISNAISTSSLGSFLYLSIPRAN